VTIAQDAPDLASYDILLANISGGKDSQTMLRRLVNVADELGIRDRIVCVFADLGEDDEWEGTEDIARYHAAHYGVRFIAVRKGEAKGAPVGLLEHIERRGMWPDAKNRYCTSDLKRDPIATVLTRLVKELALGRQARILNVMGMRAQESPKRAMLPVFKNDTRATNGKRHVDVWLPIHELTEAQVWADIAESGVKHHWAYDAGMPRLSCMFCVLASEAALVRAAQLNPKGAQARAELETKMGHTFQNGRSMKQIIAKAEAATAAGIQVKATNWNG
jgi:3'-phosphoadenosine 5'-phosphosulfate sulfotransferase (PAPS reductase)/FAD synthetase